MQKFITDQNTEKSWVIGLLYQLPIPLMLKNTWKRGQKEFKSVAILWTPIISQLWLSVQDLHKIKQVETPSQMKDREYHESPLLAEEIWKLMVPGEGQFSLVVLPLVDWLCWSVWPHTHTHMCDNNWTQWGIKRTKQAWS